ncbi:unnamed protein product [Rotaria sp. Silwood2]|nr:unnamed protein product [Rotaria sp. Silwood2]
MPTIGTFHGQQYVPTPIHLQGVRDSLFTDGKSDIFSKRSISPIITTSSSIRTEQRSLIPTTKIQSNLQTASGKAVWSTKQKIIVGVVIAAIAIAIIITVIVLSVLLSRKSDATTTTATTTQTTAVTIAYWSFDSITTDFYNVYNGVLMNSAPFFSNTTTQPYVGIGGGLSLTASSSQYFSVSSPFLDLTYKSFTIETWIYPSISSTADYGIFGQCQCSSCPNQCLYFIIRSYRLYVSFMNNDLSGSTILTSNTWYHIAFVYNYNTRQQILYINGYQDAIKSNSNSYQGTNGSILIGAALVYLTTSYYSGLIDNVKITTRAKSATEILNVASLTAYFSFDQLNPTDDSGPLELNGIATNIALVDGRVNEAMRFSGSSSYFYAYGFFQIGQSVISSKPFSVSLWINPSSTASCTLVQTIGVLNSSPCHNLLGFYSAVGSTMQILVQGYGWPLIYGPFVTVNTWTHISVTYSQINGLRLYVNGVYYGSSGSFTFSASGRIMYLALGYMSSCGSNIINAGYQGLVDEVYVHSREISQSEVSALANP